MKHQKLTCDKVNQIDLVDYLKSLGYQPKKIRAEDYWFCSPFRDEKTASFKVNRTRNIWFDFGEGKGGDFIDFGVRFYLCSVSELLQKLSREQTLNFSFHPPSFAGEKKEEKNGKILILNERRLSSKFLLDYLQKRCIPVEIAEQFCRQIDFLLYGKKYTAIGFKNNAGGYELRSENFKGSSSPKDITFIDNNLRKLSVFEGFFSYLSFQTINQNKVKHLTNLPKLQTNFLILNSLSFFQRAREKMEQHEQIFLYLDNDNAGKTRTQQALQLDKNKYVDRSTCYEKREDLNDWLIHHEEPQKQSLRIGRHF